MTDPNPEPTQDSATGPDGSSTPQSGWVALFLLRVVAPLALIAIAVMCAGIGITMRPRASKADVAVVATTVEVVEARSGESTAQLYANGVVEASKRITLLPEVSGRITWVSDAAIPGGFLAKGDVLARIDSRDYTLAVEQAKAQVRQAEVELELERGRGEVSRREWELLRSDRQPEGGSLALRGPQLAAAEQGLASAQANLEKAEIALSRTRLVAPFDAVVLDESVDLGQVVSPGAPLATLIGTERFWVTVSLPVDELGAVVLPDGNRPGSAALIRHDLGSGTAVVRRGQVEQLKAQLDPQTRTAQLVVAIDRPMEDEGGGLPLLPGAYVEVILEGRTLSDVVRMPRTALHDGKHVWVVDATDGGDVLARRLVEVGWKEQDDLLITDGLSSGDRIVVSPLSLPIVGMPVEVLGAGEEEARRD
jgi:RND family efflux transporter MFP subunit